MKTKFNYLALSALALILGLASCSNKENTEDGNNSNEPKSVFLKISKETTPTTYSEGGSISDATPVVFGSGDLYFVNASGAILKHYTLSSTATNIGTGGTNIGLADIQAGQAISNLPGQVTSVYVVGNGSGLPTTGNISAVKSKVLQITSQSTISAVNLYGTNTLTLQSGTSYTCSITLKPTVARIELSDITAAGVITGFQVNGIFIDNYYSQGTSDGTVAGGNLVSNGASASDFNDNSGVYPTALKPSVYDFYTSGLAAVSKVAAPTTPSTVWAYNLFANTAGSGTFAVPRIIIRLSNITTNDGSSYTSPQFITVRGFKASGTSITSFDAAKIYKIGAGVLTFSETDLAPVPNLSSIDIEVTISLATWTAVNIVPEL